jgi:three-Cys-motif partner protein
VCIGIHLDAQADDYSQGSVAHEQPCVQRGEYVPAPKTTTWDIEPHTQVKHVILKRYLDAWLSILSSTNGRILVVDGFAGPGIYNGGEPGSPIIAIEAFLNHNNSVLRTRVVEFIFIEENSDRLEVLKDQVNSKYPPDITSKVHYYHGKFDDTMTAVLDALDQQGHRMAPAFAFVDPFGFSDTPISTLGRIMQQEKCELLINFMHGFVQRFINNPDPAVARHYDDLFGTSDWRGLATTALPTKEREGRIHDLYQAQLQRNGARYVRSFRLRNKFNQTEYFLFFATNHLLGLDRMKQAMWRADRTGAMTSRTTPTPQVPYCLRWSLTLRLLSKQLRPDLAAR